MNVLNKSTFISSGFPWLFKLICAVWVLMWFPFAQDAFSQQSSGHNHHHTNSHAHDSTHNHTHKSVDYSFRPDGGSYRPPLPDEYGYYWWKGNLHTHTLWSDGDQFPEVVTQWYHRHGYHFLAISDHNVLLRGENWINPAENPYAQSGGGMDVFDVYRNRFGDDWIETRETDGELEVRLQPLSEVRALFEEAGRFIMIESQEITEREHIIHVNATNILEFIEPQTGQTVEETIRLNLDAVMQQRQETGRKILPHLNHPNFRHAVTAEAMAQVENLTMFEVYNGHTGTLNYGDDRGAKHLGRIWDIILTRRLAELNLGPVYGVAVDDAHHYEESVSDVARPGRGWVHVRSKFLTPQHIVRALENGKFYSSSGVTVKDIIADSTRYKVSIDAEKGVDYTIRFIGTRRGYDPSSEPFVDDQGQPRDDRTRIYSDEIGVVLQETTGTEAVYEFDGYEIYVRAKVISSKLKENYFFEGEKEKAWMQPVVVGGRK